MNRIVHHSITTLLCGAAASALVATCVLAQADEAPATRAQVRQEMAYARAHNMLDHTGELGATEDVLLARELFNATQARVLIAKAELEQRIAAAQDDIARAEAAQMPQMQERPLQPEQVAYVEQGRQGPVVVLINVGADGSLGYVDGPMQATHTVALDMD